MYETIVVATVALSLLVTLAFEIADSIVDRRRMAAHRLASKARAQRPLLVASRAVSVPPVSALPEAA